MLKQRIQPSLGLEFLQDFRYADHQSILLPASKILIGTGGLLEDAKLYSANSLTFSFANGTGDNGLDTGAEAQDQWYALYAVPKAGTSNFILKASAQAPIQAGGSGPTGFPVHRYLGLFKNGTNTYDATNGSYGRGDIVRFVKLGNHYTFNSFSSTNGGQYPVQGGQDSGINLFIANTATNGLLFDGVTVSNTGFSGNNIHGGVKLPYQQAFYVFHVIGNGNAESYAYFADPSGNQRQFIQMTKIPSSSLYHGQSSMTAFMRPGEEFVARIYMIIAGNPNVSRSLSVKAMLDPYILGGN